MSRYIDADALKEWLDEYLSVFKKYDKGTIKGFVDHAPSIDIVRCKECRFGQWHEQAEEYICIAHDQDLFDAEHFCSYGERSEL